MLAIKNNIMAGNAARHLGIAYDSLAKSVERLASGLRINSAKDDAAGLAVRELIRADIAVLQQGSRNAQDGISMMQTMEGAMAVIDDSLIRMKELAEQAATGSYSSAQRTIMNAEFSEMASEIERIAGATSFNGITMLNTSTGNVAIHVGTTTTIDVDKVDMTQSGLNIATGSGNWAVISNDDTNGGASGGYAATSTTAMAFSGGAYDFDITFGSGVVAEEVIDLNLASGATGQWTLEALKDAINDASQNPGTLYDADGNSLAYAAATIVQSATGNYKLQVSARNSAATEVTFSIGVAGATSVMGVFGTNTAAADLMDDSLFQASAGSTGGWIEDTDGGAGAGLNILTEAAAITALATVGSAISTKDTARAAFGYKMNRLESTIAILNIQSENMMSAESRISDVDVATEMAALTRTQVLAQAGISMLAQANTMPQMALSLLR